MIDYNVIWLVAVIIEVINLILRFKFKITSKNSHIFLIRQFGIKKFPHVHHLYSGILIAIIGDYLFLPLVVSIGLGIALSDVLHHIILYLVKKDAEFSILYRIKF